MSVEPIRPEDVVKLKTTIIPDQVIESFNKLIAKNFRNSSATFDQDEVIEEICSHAGLFVGEFAPSKSKPENIIMSECWLDVEDIYRKAGWSVKCDSPCWNETGNSYFTFTKKK
jgi:hypothetical protein